MTDRATASARLSKAASGGSAIAIAMALMNIATYGYQMIAAWLLGPRSFGGFAALMNLLLVVTVLALALQANAARRIAAEPGDVYAVEAAIGRVGKLAAVGLAVFGLALAPVINTLLRLDSLATALLVGATALPLTLLGAQLGVLQGERRWTVLGWVYLASGLPRLLIGSICLYFQPSTFWAIFGVMLGAWAPVIVGAIALRRPREIRDRPVSEHTSSELWRETLRNALALLAYFALSNADVLVARNGMDNHQAGLYAAGLIVTKAVLFLPQFIVVIAFPSMGASDKPLATLFKGLAAIAGIGVLAAVATKLLSGLALIFTGGPQYAEIENSLWKFALLGGALAINQLLVYGLIARQSRYSIYLVWLAFAVVVFWGRDAANFTELVHRVALVDLCLLLALLPASMRALRKRPHADAVTA